MFKKAFKHKSLNYKKVGYTYCLYFTGYKLFDSKNFV